MIAIITGGSSGIGAAAARALRERGATVVITGRSTETARLAAELGCDHFVCDFASFRDVRALAAALLAKYPRIDVLANNVGGVIATRQVTEDGHEKTLQVNHLSGFLLTMLLRERLEASGATIINTASGAHRMGHIDFTDLENEKRYSPWRAYGNAKLMNILHAVEINLRFKGVRAASFHPGVVATGFAREGATLTRILYDVFGRIFMLSPEQGADTLVWMATSTGWPAGEFFVKRRVAKKSVEAADSAVARKLWDVSMAAVGMPAVA